MTIFVPVDRKILRVSGPSLDRFAKVLIGAVGFRYISKKSLLIRIKPSFLKQKRKTRQWVSL